MKRIIVGDFKSMKKIEKLLIKGEDGFGVYSDFQALNHLDIDKLNTDEIVFYLEDLKIFNEHHRIISRYKDKSVLLLAKKEVRRHQEFLENEGYSTSFDLKSNKVNSSSRREASSVFSPQVILFVGRFDIAFKSAFVFSEVSNLRCAFWDLDSLNGFSQLRLKLNSGEPWVYLNECLNSRHTEAMIRYGNLSIAPVIQGTDMNQLEIESWIEGSRRNLDIQFVYCHMGDMDLIDRLLPLVQRIIPIMNLDYERFAAADKWLSACDAQGKGSILGIDGYISRTNYLAAFQWINADILGIMRYADVGHSDCRKKWISLQNMSKKEKRAYIRILRALDLLRG